MDWNRSNPKMSRGIMALEQSFGIYKDKKNTMAEKTPDLSLDFVVPLELIENWKKCSLVSNFFANYQSFNFKDQEKVVVILSTVINELLENAIKFTSDKNKLVSISLKHFDSNVSIETVNLSNAHNVTKLKTMIRKLTTSDPEKLILEQIESAAEHDLNESGLGLLTILRDFEASLGIKIIEKPEIDLYEVFTKIVFTNEAMRIY
jgi:hypothetical protein